MRPLFCAWVLGLGCLLPVQAHRLTIDWALEAGTLEIRATAGTEPAAGAEVQIFDPSGVVLAEGALDGSGRFWWEPPGGGAITVEVNAGLGHRRSLTLSREDLRVGMPPLEAGGGRALPPSDPLAGSLPQAAGSSDTGYAEAARVVLGLTFLMALAAAWMSYRNARRLADLERRLGQHEGRG